MPVQSGTFAKADQSYCVCCAAMVAKRQVDGWYTPSLAKLLTEQLSNSETQWSIGTFGGLAEFLRDADEPAEAATAIKRQVVDAIERGILPSALRLVTDRSTRTVVRVAVRQLKAADHTSQALAAWQNEFDIVDLVEDDVGRMHQN